jgi:thiosulfate/3-mercaptopyruvate sulfurtransferase
MGHDDVVVLDGGFPAWERAGYPIETGAPQKRMERHFTPRVRRDLVRDITDVRAAIETGRTQILDARPKERFEGAAAEPRAGMRSGHMPGAVNVPLAALTENGLMRSREDLEHVFAERGVATNNPVVCSCGSGVTAAVIALALARLGRWDAPIYDGSWSEWGSRQDTPVVTGA